MANTSTSETATRLKKQLTGVVISDKMNKTVVVRTDRRMIHPLYEKVVVVSKKFVAHDESNERKIGDQVRIQQTRPLSKTKRWVVIETLRQAPRETKEVKAASEKRASS
jgi:small subunit ribosomal protein S17